MAGGRLTVTATRAGAIELCSKTKQKTVLFKKVKTFKMSREVESFEETLSEYKDIKINIF